MRNLWYQQRTKATPYKLFVGKRPNLSNMVTYGNPCYVYTEDKVHKRKLDDRLAEVWKPRYPLIKAYGYLD